MLRAFSTAATGMMAQQMIVDVTANNLANINTNGFKRSQVDFQDLMYVKLMEPGAEVASGVTGASGIEIGSGVRAAGTVKVFTTGELESTSREFDLAIQGSGFFQVTTPGGETQYTRDGAFKPNANGQLVTSSGCVLVGISNIPAGTRKVTIAQDGTVSAFVGASNTPTNAGTIVLARFPNASGLSSKGGNLLAETAASGAATTGTPGMAGFGQIQQGHLEKSNVQMIYEMVTLIKAQRAYEINSRAIRAGDEMLSTANQLIR